VLRHFSENGGAWSLVALVGLAACANTGSPTSEPSRSPPSAAPATAAPTATAAPAAARAAASGSGTPSPSTPAVVAPVVPRAPQKVEVHETAMGTSVTFVAYTSERTGEAATRAAITRALAEIARLESLMSEWRDDSEVGKLNAHPGEWVKLSPETLEVIEKGLWAGKLSGGTFDVTFQVMSRLWKFGGAEDPQPTVPPRAAVSSARRLIDYRKVEISRSERAARLGKDQQLGLGGIAKGYIVDRAARVLREAGLTSFLVQAGGDLYGAGRKPDGTRWVSGIQDPRGRKGQYFATVELEDHAFSTAGDYARSYLAGGKRYHHIIDPRTGYPATACRSVTVWAPDALVADAVDDIVFILGPEKGLPLVESLDDVGVVVVDQKNRVRVSPRLAGKVHLLGEPTDGL
jgi:FAD:protein FMN transferase